VLDSRGGQVKSQCARTVAKSDMGSGNMPIDMFRELKKERDSVRCECCNLEFDRDRFDMQKLWTTRIVGRKKYYFCPRCKKHMLERIRSYGNAEK